MTMGNDHPARSPGKWTVKIKRAPAFPRNKYVNKYDEFEFEFIHQFTDIYELGSFLFPCRVEGTKVTIVFSNDFEHFDPEAASAWAWEEGLKLL